MRTIALLAVAAGSLALSAPAGAATCYGAVAGGTNAYVCNERVWEKQRWYLTCSVDAPGEKLDASCGKKVLIEYYG